MSKKLSISASNDIALKLKALAKEKEDIRLKLEVTAEELAEVKAKDAAILASIGDGLVATDAEGKIVLVNKAFEKILGWKESEVKGRLLTEIVPATDEHGEPIPFVERPINKTLSSTTTTTTTTCNYTRRDGTTFPVAITVASIFLENKSVCAVEVFRDIIKEKEIDQAKTDFISMASHQLRTPITGLQWTLNALHIPAKVLDTQQQRYLENISGFVKRLVSLSEELLNVSRIESGTLAMDSQTLDIKAFFVRFMVGMKPYATVRNHTIALEYLDGVPASVVVDSEMLYNVLENIVSNGIDYSPPDDSTVTIKLQGEGATVRISVSNDGPSISAVEQSRIFAKFYRSETIRKIKPTGMGIGLFIAKSFVERWGGRIGVISHEGQGAEFWFTIPV